MVIGILVYWQTNYEIKESLLTMKYYYFYIFIALISIVTSKDLIRSKKLLKKFNLKFDSLHCPTSKIPGKPNPALILKSLNKIRIKKNYVCYVGDTRFDQVAAKRAGISFVYANYGYGNLRQKKLIKISSFSQLENFF